MKISSVHLLSKTCFRIYKNYFLKKSVHITHFHVNILLWRVLNSSITIFGEKPVADFKTNTISQRNYKNQFRGAQNTPSSPRLRCGHFWKSYPSAIGNRAWSKIVLSLIYNSTVLQQHRTVSNVIRPDALRMIWIFLKGYRTYLS